MIGTDVCACGCGEAIVQVPGGRARIYVNRDHMRKLQADQARERRQREMAEAALAARPPLPAPHVDQSGPAPKLCGLCPMQSRRGNHSCTHLRLAAKWINEPASEARIHGACPWGRPEVSHPPTTERG